MNVQENEDYGEEVNEEEIRHIQVPQMQQKQKIYKRFRVRVYLDMCKYNVVHDLCEERRWKECEDTDDWNLFWYDWSVSNEIVVKMQPYQKINHFPGMEQITRKDTLARNMNRCRKCFPELYDFFPASYYLPADKQDFIADYERHKGRTYISKPVASCQGRGIKLFTNINSIDLTEPQVIQVYIKNPFLIDGYKFDLRLYVVVLQVLPYPVVLYYNDGMARFCTTPFQEPNPKNIKNTFMHLTNYALNKVNPDFQYNQDADADDQGSKQGLQVVLDKMQAAGCDVPTLQAEIHDLCLKTIFGILPNLQHSYLSSRPGVPKFIGDCDPFTSKELFYGSGCFEILGFDVLVDSKFKPWLIEVNHSPSFTCDTPLDLRIKERLIGFVLDILDLQQDDKIIYEKQERIQALKRLYGKQTSNVLKSRKKLQKSQTNIQNTTQSKNAQGQPQKRGAVATKPKPTYSSIQRFYAEKVAQSSGLFEMIYPLKEDDEDIYREIVLNLKNPFISDASIQNMNAVVPMRVEVDAGNIKMQMSHQVEFKVPEKAQKLRPLTMQEVAAIKSVQIPSKSDQQPRESMSKSISSKQIDAKQSQNSSMEGIKRQAMDEMEFGKEGRNLIFRAKQPKQQVLLRQGAARNQQVEQQMETELFNRKMVLKRFKLQQFLEQILEDERQAQSDIKVAAPRTNYAQEMPEFKKQIQRSLSGLRAGGAQHLLRGPGRRRAAVDDSNINALQ